MHDAWLKHWIQVIWIDFSVVAHGKVSVDRIRDRAAHAYSAQPLEGLYKSKLQDSVQLQTVLALCEQQLDRDRAVPSCQRLKTMVRRHIDQMIRTRNIRAQNERIETGVLVTSQKGKNVIVERRMGEW